MTGHEDLIEGLTLPDMDDRYVLAAGIRCNASVIITFNQKGHALINALQDQMHRSGLPMQVSRLSTVCSSDPELSSTCTLGSSANRRSLKWALRASR